MKITHLDPNFHRIGRGERAKRLCDLQRHVVRQHDATRADAERGRRRRDLPDDYLGRGARDALRVVMLRDPEPSIAQRFRMPGEIHSHQERITCRLSRENLRQIENGERQPSHAYAES